ncbi:hypothetical protein O6H91_22G069000 [Diphasiastrum complanatum]|nr:hypothetical protein O6H91_22G069000 [Diphasiastrum complanatum]
MAPISHKLFRNTTSSFGSSFPGDRRIHPSSKRLEVEQLEGDRPYNIAGSLQELETVLLGGVALPSYCAPGLSPDMNWSDSIQEHMFEGSSAAESQPENNRGCLLPSPHGCRCNIIYSSENIFTNSTPNEAELSNDPLDSTSSLEHLLLLCAQAVANEELDFAHDIINKLNQVVSIYGDPMQRLAAYMVEGLVAKLELSGKGLYSALKCKEPPLGDLLSAMQIMYEVCPYFKFGYMAANGAIAEAFRDEDRVHIIDFEIAQGTQWISLIQALAARPGGAPHVRITGVGDSRASSRGLQVVRQRLTNLAESVKVPFEFHPLPMKASDLQPWMFEVKPGEAVAVNLALQLHHMPDESVCTTNPRDRQLRMIRGLNPKVMTVVEQEANTNTAPFFARFTEVLSYYSAVFESLDVTLPRESRDRVNVEQQCLARDIVNIIACEGADRVERHEVLGKWRARMIMAGFQPYPLSSYVNATIKSLLESYSDKYRLKEENGALFLGWLNRMLIVASAWH